MYQYSMSNNSCFKLMVHNLGLYGMMSNLFDDGTVVNLLPYDGEVYYYGKIMPDEQASTYTSLLLDTVNWKNDEVVIFGRHIVTSREIAWYGDENYAYTYSNTTKQAQVWTKELLVLKEMVELKTSTGFNSCLLNLYHNGSEGMSWHSDDEKALGKNTAIASLSFGAERKFSFKHKTSKQSTSLILESGSLLLMKGATQRNWLHHLPKTTKVTRPRINLTFRNII